MGQLGTNIDAGVNAVGWAVGRMKVSLRDVAIVRDETDDGVRMTSGIGSAQRFVKNLKKVRELKIRQSRRFCAAWVLHEIGAE